MTPRCKAFILCVTLIFGFFVLARVTNPQLPDLQPPCQPEVQYRPCPEIISTKEDAPFTPDTVLRPAALDLVFKLPVKPFNASFRTFEIEGTQFFANDDGPIGVAKYLEEDPGEVAVAKVLSMLLPKGCKEGGLFLDIGANSGIYGIYAAKLGCRSFFFDLQPTCHMSIQSSLLLNGLSSNGYVIPRGVNHVPIKIKISPASNCHGQFMLSSSDRFEQYAKYYPGATWQETETLIVDDVFREGTHIYALKIDTEGAEYGVLKSMWKMLEKGRIRHLIVEVTPSWWKTFNVQKKQFANEISQLWDFGYTNIVKLSNAKWETIKTKQAFLDLLSGDFPQVNFYISQDPLPY